MKSLWDAQKQVGTLRNVSTLFTTGTGGVLPIPTTDDTSNTGEIIAEAGAVTTTADPTFGVINVGAFRYSSKALIVSYERVQDSFIDLPAFLCKKLGERSARPTPYHAPLSFSTKRVDAAILAVLEWVDWFNNRRLLEPIGYLPPAELEAAYHHQVAVTRLTEFTL
jgi:Phage capsid family